METKAHFATIGTVRGDCGHKHLTIGDAVRCLHRDRKVCESIVGAKSYSDRRVVLVINGRALGGAI